METQLDGSDHSQSAGDAPLEDDLLGDVPNEDAVWRRNADARFDLLNDSLTRINQALANIGSQPISQAQLVEDNAEFDDDEPLTPSKVNKIVNRAITSAVKTSSVKSEREKWDNKARGEYPISDPKFEAQFNKEWRSFQEAGGDIYHPRAVYKICTDTARLMGLDRKPKPQASRDQDAMGGESPNATGNAAPRRTSSSKISDDDPKVVFFKLRNSDPKAVEKFKKKLEDKANAENSKRRPR